VTGSSASEIERPNIYQSLFARTRDLVYRYRLEDPVGFEYVSPSALSITGYTPEEHYADPELGLKLVHPDDREQLAQAAAGEGEGTLLLRWVRKDGRAIWTEQHNVLVRDAAGRPIAVEGVARDVTEREEVLARLRESEQRYRSLVAALAEGVVLHDAEGRIVTCNPAAERILGLTLDQMRGLTARDPRWGSIHEDGTPYTPDQHPSVVTRLTGRSIRNELMGVRHADGSLLWMLVNTEPLVHGPGERPSGVVISFTEVTAEREANERLREALRAVRTLSGLLPICAHCKKIRTDAGYWQQIDAYVAEHSMAEFSHGICPDCVREHYPEVAESEADRR
jgi:PAS domain S-box-containing protein